MLDPIVRSATANTAVDPDKQRLLAYDRRRDRFVEPGGWFSRPELFLVTNQRDPKACIESDVDWHVPGIDGGEGVPARSAFRVACVPGEEESFVRAWALEPVVEASRGASGRKPDRREARSGDEAEPGDRAGFAVDVSARVLDLFARAAATIGTEGSVSQWTARLAVAVTELAAAMGASVQSATELGFEESGTYWDVVTFAPADGDGATRDAEVDLRFASDLVDGAMAGVLRYTEAMGREHLRGAVLAALEEHIGLDEPLSRLSSSGRAVSRAVDEAAAGIGMAVQQLRLAPVQLEAPREVSGSAPIEPRSPAGSSPVGEAPVEQPVADAPPGSGAEPRDRPRFDLGSLSERLASTMNEVARVSDEARRLVSFTAYHPRRVAPDRRHTFLVFAVPGAAPPGGASVTLAPGTQITVVLEADAGLSVEPPQQTVTWRGDKLRIPFDVRPLGVVGSVVTVRVSVQVAGVEIACVPGCEITLSREGAEERQRRTVVPYQKIFASYEPADEEVIQRLDLARQALGDSVILDASELRGHADWRTVVRQAIDEADVFQLFWSEHAAASDRCAFEWRRAKKVAAVRGGFIRAVYWEDPPPPVPDELQPVVLARVPPS